MGRISLGASMRPPEFTGGNPRAPPAGTPPILSLQ